MYLGFLYFENNSIGFKKDFVRYNHLLKNYFDNSDQTIVKKLVEVYKSLLSHCTSYEVLSEKETEVYNVIIDFMANDLTQDELDEVQNQNYSENIKSRIADKMTEELPEVDPEILQSVMQKSSNMVTKSDSESVEILFIPSVLNVKEN